MSDLVRLSLVVPGQVDRKTAFKAKLSPAGVGARLSVAIKAAVSGAA